MDIINEEMVEKVTQEILNENTEDDILEAVAELIPEFLDDGWEEEYDGDMDEAYIEQGRGEAEGQILNDLIREKDAKYNFSLNDFCEIHDNLKDEWCL